MSAIETAKALGNGESIWASGTNIETAPSDLAVAVNHAISICSWRENLASDEMPPQWMWHLDWELAKWFKDISKKRDEKYGSSGDDPGAVFEENELFESFTSN